MGLNGNKGMNRLISVLQSLLRPLFGVALFFSAADAGKFSFWVPVSYIFLCIPLCWLGKTPQDRLFALLGGVGIALILAIPALVSIVV